MDRSKKSDGSKSSLKHQKNTSSSQTDPQSQSSSNDQLQIGQVTFKLRVSHQNLRNLFKNKEQKRFQKKSWRFRSSHLAPDNENQLYSHIDGLAIGQLEYNQTKVHNILKIVQHINFKNLTKLVLKENFITNIEPLGQIDAQNLKYIDLSFNFVCQSKSLSKLNLTKLQYLEVCSNPLFELNIGRIRYQNHEIYPRLITFPSETVLQQVSFLAKLQHHQVSGIMEFDLKYYTGQSQLSFTFNRNRSQSKIIPQQKVCHSLNEKFFFATMLPNNQPKQKL